MSDIVLSVENVSKLYRLGEIGTGTISHDLNRWLAKIRGKEDPFSKIGAVNDRTQKAESNFVWALKDIDFQVSQGDVLGIIGKNGAGKSTLLKLISRITSPSTGLIKIKGRIASLLEVGTGMHPEMTARENIYLNGAIMGMTKKEISRKFDAILDFAGCTMYVDTPVKRFSSGMRVRLGFAVAAFLEPEILIVDEVLAVGDAEFQKKALGKMKDVSQREGRTVLFVSHNLAAVKDLCKNGMLIKNGSLSFSGTAQETVLEYQKIVGGGNVYFHDGSIESAIGNNNIRILEFSALPTVGEEINIESGINVLLKFYNSKPYINIDATFELRTSDEVTVFHHGPLITQKNDAKTGIYNVTFKIPSNLLNAGNYYFKVIFGENQRYVLYTNPDLISFEVQNISIGSNSSTLPGVIRPNLEYTIDFNYL
jgi:lipopolysaccharide transport system ATP-binding protein